MTDFKDPDFSAVDALPDPDKGSKLSAELEQLSKGIRATAASIDVNTSGRTPESVVNAAGEAAKGAQDLATNAAIAEQAIRMLKSAKAEWEKATIGARAVDLTKAEQAVTEAKKKLAEAAKAEETARAAVDAARAEVNAAEKNSDAWMVAQGKLSGAKIALQAAEKVRQAAEKALQDRRKEFNDMREKRRIADEAYESARTRACEKMAEIKGAPTENEQDGGNGYGKPGGTGADTGSGYGKPGTVTGPGVRTPAPTPGTPAPGAPAPKSPGTPAPKGETPESKGSGSPDAASLAAAQALLNGQGQQNQQQAAGAAPAATQPQQAAQAPQQEQKKPGEKSDLEKEAEKNGAEALGLAGLESPLGVVGAPIQATGPGAPQSAPSGQHGYSPRPAGTPITGTVNGGTPLSTAGAQQVTSGDSKHGMTTPSDTSGRSTPTAGAYDSTKTSTSAANGTAAGASPQSTAQQTGRGQMPMMPMMPPMGAPAAVGSGASGAPRKAEDLPHSSGASPDGNRLDHGRTGMSEAVPGGTIAQNKPNAGDNRPAA